MTRCVAGGAWLAVRRTGGAGPSGPWLHAPGVAGRPYPPRDALLVTTGAASVVCAALVVVTSGTWSAILALASLVLACGAARWALCRPSGGLREPAALVPRQARGPRALPPSGQPRPPAARPRRAVPVPAPAATHGAALVEHPRAERTLAERALAERALARHHAAGRGGPAREPLGAFPTQRQES